MTVVRSLNTYYKIFCHFESLGCEFDSVIVAILSYQSRFCKTLLYYSAILVFLKHIGILLYKCQKKKCDNDIIIQIIYSILILE